MFGEKVWENVLDKRYSFGPNSSLCVLLSSVNGLKQVYRDYYTIDSDEGKIEVHGIIKPILI